MSDRNIPTELRLIRVEPQPTYIESSGRWNWPLPQQACFPGCCKSVVTASREWWEYAPSEAKPHPYAEGVRLRDDVWYWTVPMEMPNEKDAEIERLRARVTSMRNALEFHRTSSGFWSTVLIRMPLKDFKRVLYGAVT